MTLTPTESMILDIQASWKSGNMQYAWERALSSLQALPERVESPVTGEDSMANSLNSYGRNLIGRQFIAHLFSQVRTTFDWEFPDEVLSELEYRNVTGQIILHRYHLVPSEDDEVDCGIVDMILECAGVTEKLWGDLEGILG